MGQSLKERTTGRRGRTTGRSGRGCSPGANQSQQGLGFEHDYDLPAIETCWNGGLIVERSYDWSQRSYDWSQRSWVIARGQISHNKVDGHVQNLKPAVPNRKRSHD